jgi:2-alkyl-3-oxoalkanoate reductase
LRHTGHTWPKGTVRCPAVLPLRIELAVSTARIGFHDSEAGMKIFVTGATGVVGRRAVPLLLARGHSVTALVRQAPQSRLPAHDNLAPVSVDLFDGQALKRAAAGHDAVVNLATHIPPAAWKMLFRPFWRLNDRIRTEGSANVAAAALEGGATRLIQESFAPVYPDGGDRWIEEDTALEPVAYNTSVLNAESAAAGFSGSGRAGVVLRFAGFYGPDAIQVESYINALRRGWAALPGDPDAFISSISHDDAAAAVVAALDAPAGAYNVSDDEPVTRHVFFGTLAERLGLKMPRFLPGSVTPLLGSAGQLMTRSLRISNHKLKGATGWSPRYPSVREGFAATLAEMRM